ncbi:hypothetical protein GIB67_014044, partial [Kingdonia uniflora]
HWALGPVVVVPLHLERGRGFETSWGWKLRVTDPYKKPACLPKKSRTSSASFSYTYDSIFGCSSGNEYFRYLGLFYSFD